MTVKSEFFDIRQDPSAAMQEVINTFEEGILVFDHEFCVESANQKAIDQFGYNREQLIGKSCMELFHRKTGLCPVCQIPKTSNFPSVEMDIWGPVSKASLQIYATTVLDENGELKKVVHRILDRKVNIPNEPVNRLNLLVNHKIYEALPMSFQALDENGQLICVNSLWLKTFGFLEEEVVGKDFMEFLAPNSIEVLQAKLNRKEEVELFSGVNLKVRKKSGRYLHVLMDGIFQYDKNGDFAQTLCFLKEIQEQVSYAKSLEKDRRKAEQESKEKSALLANMSHEIRNPMNGILGFTDLLRQGDLSQEQKMRYLDLIHSNGEMLLTLINDIMNLSRLDAGQETLEEKSFSLTDLMCFLLEHYRLEIETIGHPGVELVWDRGDCKEEVFIHSDRHRLQQVMSNLIGNALKFTMKGEVRFGFRMEPDQIHFFVKDTGIGISSENQKYIFDRYKQVDQKAVGNDSGKGLGLAICKGIVDLFKGKIGVESQLGVGSEFYFSIPYVSVIEPEPSTVKSEQLDLGTQDWSGQTILIAEDEYMNYIFLKELLAPTGVNLLHAENGQQALDFLKENEKVDLVLMDIKMPVMDGYETTKRLKKSHRDLPVIAQTAFSMEEDYRKCQNAGCDDYISKPIDIPLLLSKIDHYLKQRS